MGSVIVGDNLLCQNIHDMIQSSVRLNVHQLNQAEFVVEAHQQAWELCFICPMDSLRYDHERSSYITSIVKSIDADIYIILVPLPLGMSDTLTNSLNKELVYLSWLPRPRTSSPPKLSGTRPHTLILGGSQEYRKKAAHFLSIHLDTSLQFFYTNRTIAELSVHMGGAYQALLVSFFNDFFNISEELELNTGEVQKIVQLLFDEYQPQYEVKPNVRGYADQHIKDSLDYLTVLMGELHVHSYGFDGLIRSNSFNLRRVSSDTRCDDPVNRILFYEVEQPYGCFSNFSAHPVFCREVIWKSVEHYYQAQKFISTSMQEAIRSAYTPMQAKNLAKQHIGQRISKWDDIKEQVMFDGLYAKFTQHPCLRQELLSTDGKELCEHTELDRYWGDGGDGTGKNVLGQLLMKVRSQLRSEKES